MNIDLNFYYTKMKVSDSFYTNLLICHFALKV